MKKFLVVFASLGLALSAMAQDFNEAVETFNQAAQAESKAEALNLFKQAYTQFVACGEEAEAQDKVEELKDIIPAYSVAVAKESIASKDYDAAIVALEAAAADCAEFGAEEKAAEVKDLFGFTYKASAKKALAAKDAQSAFALLKKSVEYDPNDGEAQFLLGRLYLSSGKIDEAKAAFDIASANGKEADVKKQLFNYYYNNGQKAQQAKKYAEAIEDYKAALEINPEPEKAAIFFKMGISYGALGKKAEQNEALKKYCTLDAAAAANDDILLTIAQNAVALKDAETAKEFYGKLASSKNEAYAKEAKNYLK
ncbi:MAG: tetratricopeptide repeat protein [Bacteroidales bacterium]|nr:tetratricopeptide repeat protein [Bacteroidales bacterium]